MNDLGFDLVLMLILFVVQTVLIIFFPWSPATGAFMFGAGIYTVITLCCACKCDHD